MNISVASDTLFLVAYARNLEIFLHSLNSPQPIIHQVLFLLLDISKIHPCISSLHHLLLRILHQPLGVSQFHSPPPPSPSSPSFPPPPSSAPSPSSCCSVTAALTPRISHILPPLAEHPSDFFHQADAYAFFRSQLKCLVLRVSSSTLWIRHFFLLS